MRKLKYNISKEWLYDQYINQEKTSQQIASIIGCCQRTIHQDKNKNNKIKIKNGKVRGRGIQ